MNAGAFVTVLGAFITVAGMAGVGICLCLDQRHRMQELFCVEKFLSMAAGEISYGMTGLPILLEELGKRFQGTFGVSLGLVGQRLGSKEGEPLEKIWQEEMGHYLENSRLNKEEQKLVLLLSKELDYPDKIRQVQALEQASFRIGQNRQQLVQKQESFEKMTMALCLSGGLAIAILLL